MRKCGECGETFVWDDEVITVEDNDEVYHKECVHVFPITYGACRLSEDWVGVVEGDSEEGRLALEVMDKGEYEEVEE